MDPTAWLAPLRTAFTGMTPHRLAGLAAIGFPLLILVLALAYRFLRRIRVIRRLVQTLALSLGLAVLVYLPIVFFSAFIGVPGVKLGVIAIGILFFTTLFVAFNGAEIRKFWREARARGFIQVE